MKNDEYNKSNKKTRLKTACDLLTLFFSYKTFPNHYELCRLWEVHKSQWKYYYGDGWLTYQNLKLRKSVEPREYAVLFDDKAVCDLLCKGIDIPNLPYIYGLIRPDQDYKERIRSWFQDSATSALFIKPVRGHAGRGIVVVKKINGDIMIQSQSGRIPLEEFELSAPAIVQELIQQDRRMAAFSSSSVNTIRVLTMYTKDDSVIILAASMLCGVGDSIVSNWSRGGIGLGVDPETGRLMKYAYDKKAIRYSEHPTSKIRFEGYQVPQWDRIIELAITIQKAFPCYRMLGTDFAVRENGEPVVIEVNNDPDIFGQEQSCGPLLQIEQNIKAFGEYDLLINRHQKELYEKFTIPQDQDTTEIDMNDD
ncbi:MAG: sugar-transfer associated ATP-grasp domain-containing protein [Methanoregulaceae archaeon]